MPDDVHWKTLVVITNKYQFVNEPMRNTHLTFLRYSWKLILQTKRLDNSLFRPESKITSHNRERMTMVGLLKACSSEVDVFRAAWDQDRNLE